MTDSLLSTSLQTANAAAQAEEDENRLAGNPPTPLAVEPGGVLANPEGYTPVGTVNVQTPTEVAPHGAVPALELGAAVPLSPAPAVMPADGGLGGEGLPQAGLSAAAATAVADLPLGEVLRSPALDLPTDRPVPSNGTPPPPEPSPQPTPEPQPLPEPTPLPPVMPEPPEGSDGGGGPITPPPEPPPEPPPPEPPPEPEPIEGRWKIDQTPAAGDKTGGDVIWENPEHGQKADTFFDVSFNQGSLKLEEGQRIEVLLDVYRHGADTTFTTAEREDWSFAVSGRDPHLPVVASAVNEAGQLVVTLEADKAGVNLTGAVFRVAITAVADDQSEGHEQLVFDINDTIPARDLSSGATIGAAWDAHDDLVISIEENSSPPQPLSLGELVEAFELQPVLPELPSQTMAANLTIPDPLHEHGQGHAYGHDASAPDDGGLDDVAALEDPDPLPEDQIEHASDGVGVNIEDPGGLNAAWNRLT